MLAYALQTQRATATAITLLFLAGAWPGSAQDAGSSLFHQLHASHQAPVTLTLKDALALAEKNDPTLLAAVADALVASEDRQQARAALYPSLSGRAEYLGTQGNGKLSESRFVTNDGVHVYRDWAVAHQDLSPGTLGGSVLQRAGAAQALAHAKLAVARRGLAATVTKNYYALIVAQRKYATAQTSLDQARHSLSISQDLERGREVAHSDVIRSQLLENGQQQALEEAKLTILAAALETLRGARLDVTIARQAFLPTLTVDAVYGIEANAFALHSTVAAAKADGPLPNLGYFVTASLNVPVWDWGLRRSKLKQSELKQDQANADLSATQRSLIRNLRGFYDEAQVAHNQIGLLRSAVDLASESLRLNTLRYQAGEAPIIDLVEAQASAIQARNAFSDGMARYRLAVANLQTVTGTF
jgi:outer membrane protein TolC